MGVVEAKARRASARTRSGACRAAGMKGVPFLRRAVHIARNRSGRASAPVPACRCRCRCRPTARCPSLKRSSGPGNWPLYSVVETMWSGASSARPVAIRKGVIGLLRSPAACSSASAADESRPDQREKGAAGEQRTAVDRHLPASFNSGHPSLWLSLSNSDIVNRCFMSTVTSVNHARPENLSLHALRR